MKDKAKESRPKDKSLEAYKAWIREICERLTTNKAEIILTQSEWVKSWRDYWQEHAAVQTK